MTIHVRNVTKRFDGFTALDDVSLAIEPGELVALLGPSGSGKTTLLRIIAGLEFQSQGQVLFDQEDASERHVGARGVGFVFQHYALFRHMTVFENVAFGLRVRPRRLRPSGGEIRDRVMRLLRLVQLDGFVQRYPAQLSGGQRQRVALARALAIEPRVLLLDEPFGALDAKVRKELRRWLRRLHDEMSLTSVFVTHDQEEALELADRVVVMSQGRIEQIGTPEEVYDRPATPFVYEFLGKVNRLDCTLARGRARFLNQELELPRAKVARLDRGMVYVRPEDLEMLVQPASDTVAGRIAAVALLGAVVAVEVELAGGKLVEVELPRGQWRALGMTNGAAVWLRAREARLFEDIAREIA
jgi:sulfate transport system ATP-binding protein